MVTNPPFSLFREYVAQLVEHNKKFLIIGNQNAITYKEIFKLIKENKIWLGLTMNGSNRWFGVPDDYPFNSNAKHKVDKDGRHLIFVNNVVWFTNLDTPKRHEKITFFKKYYGHEKKFPHYDNYDAIEVSLATNIPYDYNGVVGVPISFMHKYNPDQFEIIKFRKGDDEKDLSINGKCPYFRILIKRKKII